MSVFNLIPCVGSREKNEVKKTVEKLKGIGVDGNLVMQWERGQGICGWGTTARFTKCLARHSRSLPE
jgi:hypothetical protein